MSNRTFDFMTYILTSLNNFVRHDVLLTSCCTLHIFYVMTYFLAYFCHHDILTILSVCFDIMTYFLTLCRTFWLCDVCFYFTTYVLT